MGETKEYAESLAEDEGLTYINGYDDPQIIAGAGTIGMEIIDDVPCVDAVVVPVGGAGLIAGVACAVKTLKPDCKVSILPTIYIYIASLETCTNTIGKTKPLCQESNFFIPSQNKKFSFGIHYHLPLL